ncbi:MAG: TM0106 family RecB-like putative nuclease [Nitrospirae bacterium]|nr:TM0106 family RecB-like putative nuclease [Nitrospirota bacterium]
MEGIPDRDFYYLIGVRVGTSQSPIQHSLWANSQYDEKRIWSQFIDILSVIDRPQIIHFGSFETSFLKHMCSRYGSPSGDSIVAQSISSSLNLLSFIFARIYFPTYSNGLKDVVRYLGFNWSESEASGINTIVWRSEWEKSHETALKQKLVTYNVEDCKALSFLTEFLRTISASRNNATGEHMRDIIHTDSLPRRSLDGQSTEKGICDYLILLSICETCRFKGLNFLDFLRSGEKDLDIYVSRRIARGKE